MKKVRLPPGLEAELAAMWRRVGEQMAQAAQAAIIDTFGNAWRSGRFDGNYVSQASTTRLGVVSVDGTSIDITDGGKISAAIAVPDTDTYASSATPVSGVPGSSFPDGESIVMTPEGKLIAFGGGSGFSCVTMPSGGTSGNDSPDLALSILNPSGHEAFALQYGPGDGLPTGHNPFTIECYYNNSVPGGGGGGGCLLSFGIASDPHTGAPVYNQNMALIIDSTSGGHVALGANWVDLTQSGQWSPIPPLAGDGQWHHVMVAYDGALTVECIVDGHSYGQQTIGRPFGIVVGADGLIVGIVNYAPTVVPFSGGVDELAIYPSRLTAADEAAHYALTDVLDYMTAVLGAGPNFYYRMDGMIGPLARDWSPFARHANVGAGAFSFNTPGALNGHSPSAGAAPIGYIPVSDGDCGIIWVPQSTGSSVNSTLVNRATGDVLTDRGTGTLVTTR